MKKNHLIQIRFSQEEREKVERKAKDAGMSLSSFIRFLVLKSEIKVVYED